MAKGRGDPRPHPPVTQSTPPHIVKNGEIDNHFFLSFFLKEILQMPTIAVLGMTTVSAFSSLQGYYCKIFADTHSQRVQ